MDDLGFGKAERPVTEYARALEREPPPGLIYHYTKEAGLLGILESGKLWLTDLFRTNDPKELVHGLNLAIEVLEAEADGRPEVELFVEHMRGMLDGATVEEVASFFICSFTPSGEDLSQWRLYADDARGYALGFDGQALEEAFARNGEAQRMPGYVTFPVSYDDGALRELQRRTIRPFLRVLTMPYGAGMSVFKDFIAELAVTLTVPLMQAATYFKSNDFRDEKEYRFLSIHKAGLVPDAKTKGVGETLVHYREFDWRGLAATALKEVVVGPAADMSVAEPLIRKTLWSSHPAPDSICIRKSRIAYRVGFQHRTR